MVIEEAEIETDVLGISSFPFQRAVFQSTAIIASGHAEGWTLNITPIETQSRNEQEIVVAQSILERELSSAGTGISKLLITVFLREEWFLADSPTYKLLRWEETPTAIGNWT